MIAPETIELAGAGGAILLTALVALRAGVPRAPAASPAAEEEPVASAPAASSVVARPRILTGEPASPEQRKPAPMRALKLVAGITTLALAGAVGLIALVRALIEMFQQIGS